ncbi:thiamine pyrophosphate-binding protein [Vibrio vulnificus]|uniref:thiamine pyrophosphate-binding protein n=1 Tax=Vibrio vulnificus TaxID=672 RepID=UPI001A1FAF46|nr:thiamine pyrophosphate-binding protein [Vibrio vulnificus]MDK2642434.1 thiamine pyrophosphate-binding protein [Vibrio vulnificus]MDK2668849.1 thiamine pyrophosphate-binding protein [Vibrio vulnificus]HAS8338589.1 2-succinyl-5-enolpyruvyl-6-hydroxy-3-cyclohexene-1-carboxylate synthase [Vibrio vulnificus]
MLLTKEINARIVISLLKQHGIKDVIASPGATNVALIGSIQNDPYFNIFSAVDERSAAYMACGLSEETGKPVVISCTGATASRNYLPGMTEAYYRKLPILAITSTQAVSKVGHHEAQVIDRSQIQNDVAKCSVTLPIVKDKDDEWECEVKVNKAILELSRNGGGPVHINLPTTYSSFEETSAKQYRVIRRFNKDSILPALKGKIGIFIGSHKSMSESEVEAIDTFCEKNNGVVFCDHTSGYNGKYHLLFSLVASQEMINKSLFIPDILIHIGEVSGDYPTISIGGNKVWRVSADGELRDKFRKLENVFEMTEIDFFRAYSTGTKKVVNTYYDQCKSYLDHLRTLVPDLPFSNIWVASKLAPQLPKNSVLHLGILNSLRSWNYFEVDKSVKCNSNVGGFGIDGIISSLLGASLADVNKPYYCVLGDLAFFYDMNTLGNRHINRKLRILVINNGKGTEFRQYNHHAASFKDSADKYIAAANHFGNKSENLIRNFSEDLGFKYLSASNKEEFNAIYADFLEPNNTERPIVFEVFTTSEEESKALRIMNNLEQDSNLKLKKAAKSLLSNNAKKFIKKTLNM